MAHTPLVTRAELPRYGVPSDFLAQFDVRPLEIQIVTGGALGTMTARWRPLGESAWSAVLTSSPRTPWAITPARSFADLSFATGVYIASSLYTVDEAGTITRTLGAIDTLTATRFDVVEINIAAVTAQAVDFMQPRMTAPLLTWGDAVKKNAASWLKYLLKSDVGMAPGQGAVGDENVRLQFEDAQLYFRNIGRGDKKPTDITDSSSGGLGAGLMVSIASDEKAGWD